MSKVVLDVSMSLDGFVAGPNVREAEPSCRATVAPPISTGQSPIRTWRTTWRASWTRIHCRFVRA
jgi:hypothetical protein